MQGLVYSFSSQSTRGFCLWLCDVATGTKSPGGGQPAGNFARGQLGVALRENLSWASSRFIRRAAVPGLGVAPCRYYASRRHLPSHVGAATHDRATGVHRPLTSTVMALAPCGTGYDKQREVILVTLDHCLLWSAEMAELLARIGRGSGTSPHSLVVTFSHTHAAGLMGLERCELPGGKLDRPISRIWRNRWSPQFVLRGGRTVPVDIVYGQGRSSLAAHRDLWDPDAGQGGAFVCGYNRCRR